jgi:hypothetical protein
MEFDEIFWWFWRLTYPSSLIFQRLRYCRMRYSRLSGYPV